MSEQPELFDRVELDGDRNSWARHPPPEEVIDLDAEWLVRCPKCHVLSELADFDSLGSDRDCVFCPVCSLEIQLDD